MAEKIRSEFKTNSYFINYYFNSLIKRLDGNKRPLIRDYLIVVSYYILALNFFMTFFIEFDYETRLILFDGSILMGGIEQYNSIISILGCLFGAYLHHFLYFKMSRDALWIKLLYMSREEIPHSLDRRELLIYRKLFSRSKIIYKALDVVIVSFGKFT
jgi:hypothetical protein